MTHPAPWTLLALLLAGCAGTVDADGDGSVAGDDCDDADARVHPGAPEACNGVDDDCDGTIDGADATDAGAAYTDADGDGYGNASAAVMACAGTPGVTVDATDCDDAAADVHPGADERCDGVDQDCDGTPDDGATDAPTWYADADDDGYGDAARQTQSCAAPEGWVAEAGDCADGNARIHPGADERCNGIDDDCDGTPDEDDAVDAPPWYADTDADGFGDAAAALVACAPPEGFVADASDCDDAAASIFPGADERCDGVDDDCDGATDEDDAVDAPTWYADGDADGFGDAASPYAACAAPPGFLDDASDCDDSAPDVSPAGVERCDGVDDDCDGASDEDDAVDAPTWYADADADGFGDAASPHAACSAPAGHLADASDCDDTDAQVFPGADERCDSVDNDCDGTTDEADAVDAPTWYADADADGYGAPAVSRVQCSAPAGYTASATDCDDADAATHPGASEACEGIDRDCDGTATSGLSVPTDQTTIADAIAASPDGATICVEPGAYAESFDMGSRSLTLRGAGSDQVSIDVGGGPIEVDGGAISGMTITGGVGSGQDGGSGAGGTLRCAANSLRLDDVVIRDAACSDTYCYGSALYASTCDLALDDVRFEDNWTDASIMAKGSLVYAYQSDIDATDVTATDNTAYGGWVYGGLFYVHEGSATFEGLTVTGTALYGTNDIVGGVAWLYGGSTAAFTHSVFDTNTASAPSDHIYGGLVCGAANALDMAWTDARGNAFSAGGVYGGMFYTSSAAAQTLDQLIVAGNTITGTSQLWGGVTMTNWNGSSSTTRVSHADIAYNTFSGKVYGGVAYGYNDGSHSTHAFTETSIVGNATSGTTYASVYYNASGTSSSSFTYGNIYDNDGTDFSGYTDPTGTRGNIRVDPDYRDVTAADPVDWDLTLNAASPARDVGDPTLSDADGTACDIGAYGGPDGGAW